MGKRLGADLVLVFVTLIWGATFVLVQQAIEAIPVFSFLAIRFLASGLLLFIPVLFMPSLRRTVKTASIWKAGAIMGFWLFAGYALQTIGLLYTTPGKAGFITGLSVVLVPLFAILFLRQVPVRLVWAGVGLATVGLFLLTFNHSGNINIGDVLEFFCAISFAMQIVMVGKYATKHAALPLTAIQITFVGLLSILAAIISHANFSVTMQSLLSPTVILALVVCSLLATVLAYFAQIAFQKFTTPTRTALIFSLEPVFAAVSAFVLIGEIMTYSAILGSVLILAGMVVAEFGGREKALPE